MRNLYIHSNKLLSTFHYCSTDVKLKLFFQATVPHVIVVIYGPGASPGFGRGGGKNIFFQIWKFASLREAMRFTRGVRGHAPHEKIIFKWCNLVRFDVYFDQILSLKFF